MELIFFTTEHTNDMVSIKRTAIENTELNIQVPRFLRFLWLKSVVC